MLRPAKLRGALRCGGGGFPTARASFYRLKVAGSAFPGFRGPLSPGSVVGGKGDPGAPFPWWRDGKVPAQDATRRGLPGSWRVRPPRVEAILSWGNITV
jgi:hypothetical protein